MFEWLVAKKLDRIGRRANPDRDFVRALEKRLTPERPSMAGWKLAAGSLTSMSLLFGGTGVYAYSSDAVLPDHPLYPVREVIERTEETVAVTPERRAAVRIKHAERRLRERVIAAAHHKQVTDKEMQRFVVHMETAIDAVGEISERDRERLDAALAKIEDAYATTLFRARERVDNDQARERLDRLVEEQTERLQKRVERLQDKRQAKFEKLRERQKLLRENRLKIFDGRSVTTTRSNFDSDENDDDRDGEERHSTTTSDGSATTDDTESGIRVELRMEN